MVIALAAEEELRVEALGQQPRMPMLLRFVQRLLEVGDVRLESVLLSHDIDELSLGDQVGPGQTGRILDGE